LFLLAFIYLCYKKDLYLAGSQNEETETYWLIIIALIIFLYVFVDTIVLLFKKLNLSANINLLFLFFVPLLGSVGTGNSITYQVIVYPVFWFLLTILFLKFKLKTAQNSFFSPLLVLMIVISSIQFYCGSFYYPYRIPAKLSTLVYKQISGTDNSTLYVDRESSNLIDSVRQVLKEYTDFKVGDPVFTYFHEAGINYFIGAQTVAFSCLTDYGQGKTNCFLIDAYADKYDYANMFYILPKFRHDTIETFKCLEALGFTFGNYKRIGGFDYFIYTANRPVEIFAPLKRLKNNGRS
jgi:hypothetical protein